MRTRRVFSVMHVIILLFINTSFGHEEPTFCLSDSFCVCVCLFPAVFSLQLHRLSSMHFALFSLKQGPLGENRVCAGDLSAGMGGETSLYHAISLKC